MTEAGENGRVEDATARLKRSLLTLSRCNRALWQARDEQELLQSICQILVETGGVRLAWIGYCEDDAYKTVRPVARAGNGQDYLERVKISWGHSAAGREPVGDALRTGKFCWIDDIRTDPRFSHGRTEAMALGYVSCVAFPLVSDMGPQGVIDLHGTLTLYAERFAEGEVEQYGNLASYLTCAVARLRGNWVDDVAYGVGALRIREDRRRADAALGERAQLLDLTHDTIFVRDMNDVITFWNNGAEELYGWTSEQAVGKASHELTQTIFPAPLEEINAELMRTGRWKGELVHRKRDGSQVVVASRWALRRDERGKPSAILETNNDITERKRAEAEARESERHYREAQMELAHANRVATMGQLTASIAHELSQPIAGAGASGHAALRWLANEPPDLEAARRAIERMIRDARRAGDVIDRIRDLVRRAPRRKGSVDMNEAIREVLELTCGEAVKNGVSVETQLAEALPLVEGDRVELRQVILNLIVNAIEAMSGTSDARRELLIATGHEESKGVLVTVMDSGPGLAQAALERVFEPFYTTKPSGLGMGLSICRSIAEAHGGRLWAEANVPCGAIFRLMVPTAPNLAL
jgi:two-component system sensor kinase FixL